MGVGDCCRIVTVCRIPESGGRLLQDSYGLQDTREWGGDCCRIVTVCRIPESGGRLLQDSYGLQDTRESGEIAAR